MVWLALPLLVPVAAVVWLVWCGGRWHTTGLVLGHLIVAVAVFSGTATAVAESKTTVCYNGPCTEHTALIFGFAAEILLTAICVVAALAAWLARGGSSRARRPLRLRPVLVACDVLALGVLAAGAVAYGNHLGDGDTSTALQPAFRSSQVTQPR